MNASRLASGFFALALAALAAAGCAAPDNTAKLVDCRMKCDELTKANSDLKAAIADKDKQAETLMALGPKRLDLLFHATGIQLGRYTGGYNSGKKEGDDGVKVFVEPVDQDASVIKAAGEIKVQLFDLAAAPKDNLVGEKSWKPDEARKHWFGNLGMYHFSFECPWSAAPPAHEDITVRVEFTDYLTGKTFTAQKVCKVRLAPAASQPATATGQAM